MKARVIAFGAMVLAACAHAGLDRAESRGAHQEGVSASEVPVRGFYVEVTGDLDTVSGELIAVDPAFVYVNESNDERTVKTVGIPRPKIRAVYVAVRDSATAGLGIWTALGCVSTASHGGFLIFSGPIWLATGISSTVSESASSKAEALEGDLDQLYQYARFPAGLPESWGGRPRTPPPAVPPVSPPPTASIAPAVSAAESASTEPPPAPVQSAIVPPTPSASAAPAPSFPPVP